jgi:hypothetical protein
MNRKKEMMTMLIRRDNERPFPPGDPAFLAFLAAAQDALGRFPSPAQPQGEPGAFLECVPILSPLSAVVQLGLLGRTWQRHQRVARRHADCLDAAVAFAVCRFALRLLREDRGQLRHYARQAPWPLDIRLDRWLDRRLDTLFTRWWGELRPDAWHNPGDLPYQSGALVRPLLEAWAYDVSPGDPALTLRGLLNEDDLLLLA